MTIGPGDVELTMDEIRVVTRFVLRSAEDVLPVFEAAHPDDPRARGAVDAARAFADGARRSRWQRTASLDAHRAAAQAATEIARLAARACGDAASSAYLHPIAKATQVGHILRGTACVAHVRELTSPQEVDAAASVLEQARRHAPAALVEVLRRYPAAPIGRSRVSELMSELDTSLRSR
ncbi:putative immunity protein [Aeromicrobium sp. CF4.19]|uniref:putative immunity protein n=1 Tax=Aeromicrobium sp. CF4.19 TaxID=3373082 RepID=UPI003EE695B6